MDELSSGSKRLYFIVQFWCMSVDESSILDLNVAVMDLEWTEGYVYVILHSNAPSSLSV